MYWLVFAIVLLVIVALQVLRLKSGSGAPDDELPYIKSASLFTAAERSFLGVLTQAVGKDFVVFGKVRVADVLSVRPGLNRSAWKTAFNRISAKHFDFVLCSSTDLSVQCVIELNDGSHAQEKRQERDGFLESACKTAGVPLVTIPAQAVYSVVDIAKKIAEGMTPHVPLTQTPTATSQEAGSAAQIAELPDVNSPATAVPSCPRCSSPMVRRTAKGEENAGREFWGCSRFPTCRGVIAA